MSINNIIKENLETNKNSLNKLFDKISTDLDDKSTINLDNLNLENLKKIINFLIAIRLYIKYLVLYYAIKIFILENLTYPKIEENFNKKFKEIDENLIKINVSLFDNPQQKYQNVFTKINETTNQYKNTTFELLDKNTNIKSNLQGGDPNQVEKKNKNEMDQILKTNIEKFNTNIKSDIQKYEEFKGYYNKIIDKLISICDTYKDILNNLKKNNNTINNKNLANHIKEIEEVEKLLQNDNIKKFNTKLEETYNEDNIKTLLEKIEKKIEDIHKDNTPIVKTQTSVVPNSSTSSQNLNDDYDIDNNDNYEMNFQLGNFNVKNDKNDKNDNNDNNNVNKNDNNNVNKNDNNNVDNNDNNNDNNNIKSNNNNVNNKRKPKKTLNWWPQFN
jgi:hypothetical protein